MELDGKTHKCVCPKCGCIGSVILQKSHTDEYLDTYHGYLRVICNECLPDVGHFLKGRSSTQPSELTEDEYYKRKDMLKSLLQPFELSREPPPDSISERHLASRDSRRVPGTYRTYILPLMSLETIRELELDYPYDPLAILELPHLRPDDDKARQYTLKRRYNIETHRFEDRHKTPSSEDPPLRGRINRPSRDEREARRLQDLP
ncbi:MAG: hypothetical protein NTZ04_00475 [Chloroflexi bacterium]|nr:hypothetical protein [Chloroflexota bacterium]